jgi:hypothetical protein
MAVPAGSAAQGIPSDPEADSPSGVVYEIPAEQGRKDAAPERNTRRSGEVAPAGTSGGSGSGGSSGGAATGSSGSGGATKPTSIRSDNNFGTSSNVPGASRRKSDGGSVNDLAKASVSNTAAASDGPSEGVVYSLVALLLAAGAGIGIFAGWRAFGRGA